MLKCAKYFVKLFSPGKIVTVHFKTICVCVCVCIFVRVYVCECWCLQRPEGGVRSPWRQSFMQLCTTRHGFWETNSSCIGVVYALGHQTSLALNSALKNDHITKYLILQLAGKSFKISWGCFFLNSRKIIFQLCAALFPSSNCQPRYSAYKLILYLICPVMLQCSREMDKSR